MDYGAHLGAVAREIDRIDELVGQVTSLDTPVPSCGDWVVGDLLTHVGEVTGFWAGLLADGLGEPKPTFVMAPEALPDRVAWLRDNLAQMGSRLASTSADLEVWTWTDDHTAGFVSRRMAHELSVHRFDLEYALGDPHSIDAALAIDGIDEIFFLLSLRPSGGGSGETFHVHATDVEGEWHLTFGPDEVTVVGEHAKGDLAVRGSASDLELLLYNREPIGPVEAFGDSSILARWTEVFTF